MFERITVVLRAVFKESCRKVKDSKRRRYELQITLVRTGSPAR